MLFAQMVMAEKEAAIKQLQNLRMGVSDALKQADLKQGTLLPRIGTLLPRTGTLLPRIVAWEH